MKETKDKDALKESIKDFRFHFDDNENARILFSAPFGTGKTTFLSEFFIERTDYVSIKLFPVNYSVASNEDIFQLIKHDILFQILGSKIELETIKFSNLEMLSHYLPGKTKEIFENLIGFIPKTGNHLIDKIKPIYEIYKNYSEYVKNIKEKSEEKDIKAFLREFSFKEGSIYEEDFITLLIRDLLATSKNTVLIIDDLDRLDPEHVFRILNIFSAHFNSTENKFGFSKIIVVCDIENIRTLFKHKYGLNTDFSGYIDKFYSKEIYHFTNYYSLTGWLNGISQITNTKVAISPYHIHFIRDVLLLLISHNKLNFRTLKKLDYTTIKPSLDNVYNITSSKNFFDFHLSRIGYLLRLIFGDMEAVYQKLNEISSLYKTDLNRTILEQPNSIQAYYRDFIFPVLTYHQHRFKIDIEFQYYDIEHAPTTLNLKLKSEGHFLYTEILTAFSSADRNFCRDLIKALKILQEKKAL